jgi:hypothetical protein
MYQYKLQVTLDCFVFCGTTSLRGGGGAGLLLLTPRLSSSPEKEDGPNGGKRHTPEQNRLLSALEAFYYCIVLLGGDANFMNKQAVGLSPPFHVRLQTPVEKAAVAARKVQRVVTKTLKDMVAQLVEEAREVQSWCLCAQRSHPCDCGAEGGDVGREEEEGEGDSEREAATGGKEEGGGGVRTGVGGLLGWEHVVEEVQAATSAALIHLSLIRLSSAP